jgi:hypothetical protein
MDRPPVQHVDASTETQLEVPNPFRAAELADGASLQEASPADRLRLCCWQQLAPTWQAYEAGLVRGTGGNTPGVQQLLLLLGLLALAAVFPQLGWEGWCIGIGLMLYSVTFARPAVHDRIAAPAALPPLLESWQLHYYRTYSALLVSGLPMTIIDNSLWECFIAGIPRRLREMILGRSQAFSERLIQATALWELLQSYTAGRPDYSALNLLAAHGQLELLHRMAADSGWLELRDATVRSSIETSARFAAIYDFFHESAASEAE